MSRPAHKHRDQPCPELQARFGLHSSVLASYVLEALPPRDTNWIEQHLPLCLTCQGSVETYRQSIIDLNDLTPAWKELRAAAQTAFHCLAAVERFTQTERLTVVYTAYAIGEALDPEENDWVDEHRGACLTCRHALKQLGQTKIVRIFRAVKANDALLN